MIVDMNISLCAYRTDSHWDTVLCFCNDAETVAAMLLFFARIQHGLCSLRVVACKLQRCSGVFFARTLRLNCYN